jgi:hypothetical protein
VPALPGAVISFDGTEYEADDDGKIFVSGAGELHDMESRVRYVRWDGDPTVTPVLTRFAGLGNANQTRSVEAVFETTRKVRFSFSDLDGRPVDLERITTMTIKNSLGVFFEYDAATLEKAVELPSQRTIQSFVGYVAKEIYYTVQDVEIDGTNTVNRSQQKFLPSEVTAVNVQTQFYNVRIDLNDALFGFPSGDSVLVRWPDGAETTHPAAEGMVSLYLPRGAYDMRIAGNGLKTWRPVSVSRDQLLELELFSYVDIAVILLGVLVFVVLLIALGRIRVRNRSRVGYFLDAPGATDPPSPDGATPSGSPDPPVPDPSAPTSSASGSEGAVTEGLRRSGERSNA